MLHEHQGDVVGQFHALGEMADVMLQSRGHCRQQWVRGGVRGAGLRRMPGQHILFPATNSVCTTSCGAWDRSKWTVETDGAAAGISISMVAVKAIRTNDGRARGRAGRRMG